MNKMSLLVITALLSSPVFSAKAEWLWEKSETEQEFNAEQDVRKAKSDLKELKTQAHEDKEVREAKDKLAQAKINLKNAERKAGYATDMARKSDTSRKGLSSDMAVEQSKVELDYARDQKSADRKVRRAQKRVSDAQAHLEKTIAEANYTPEK